MLIFRLFIFIFVFMAIMFVFYTIEVVAILFEADWTISRPDLNPKSTRSGPGK